MKPIALCSFKNTADDFIVKECLSNELLTDLQNNQSTQKEHLWLYIKKRHLNTQYAINLIASWANVPVYDIGYSGLKDRHATTYQWISIRLPKNSPESFNETIKSKLKNKECLELVDYYFYAKKLNKGTHKTNYFQIILKDIAFNSDFNQESCDTFLSNLTKTGIPNYFGQQRFGNNNQNIQKTFDYFDTLSKTKKLPKKLNANTAFLVSVARSILFNEMLAKRVHNHTWNRAIDGDIFNLNGSNSLFTAQLDDDIITRVELGDIHPTAPLYGIGAKFTSQRTARQLEESVLLDPYFLPLKLGLERLKIKEQRRALRVLLKDFKSEWRDNTLQLSFELPKGAFATSVLSILSDTLIDKMGDEEVLEN